MKSIITKNLSECYVCKVQYNIQMHHVLFGSKRKCADQDGLIVPLCIWHHTGSNLAVHSKNGHLLDLKLKRIAEKKWLEYYGKSIEDFIERYGENYL